MGNYKIYISHNDIAEPGAVDWLDFIARLVDAIAWPVIIIGIFYIFKKEIKYIITNIEKWKYGDHEIILKKMKEVRDDNQSIDPPPVADHLKKNPQFLYFMSLAETHPARAMDNAHQFTESKIREFRDLVWDIKGNNIEKTLSEIYPNVDNRDFIPLSFTSGALRSLGWISSTEYNIIENLRIIKEKAVFGNLPKVDYDVAKEYIENCEKFMASLEAKMTNIAAKSQVKESG